MAPSFIELDAIPLKMGINLQTSFYQKKKKQLLVQPM
jgi:hypothetical protein